MKINKSINDQLLYAASSGSTEDVERCLSQPDCDPLVRDQDGMSVLMWAAWTGSEAGVRLLLPMSDPLAKDNNGSTALMWAAYRGQEACVKLLLPVSDPLVKSNNGYTALMWPAESGHEACVMLLLPHSDPSALDKDGRSVSQIARYNGHSGVASMIEAYVLAQKEAAHLNDQVRFVPRCATSQQRL